MEQTELIRYGMQNLVSGVILYSLWATQSKIQEANQRLEQYESTVRFVPLEK